MGARLGHAPRCDVAVDLAQMAPASPRWSPASRHPESRLTQRPAPVRVRCRSSNVHQIGIERLQCALQRAAQRLDSLARGQQRCAVRASVRSTKRRMPAIEPVLVEHRLGAPCLIEARRRSRRKFQTCGPCTMAAPSLAGSIGFCLPWRTSEPPTKTTGASRPDQSEFAYRIGDIDVGAAARHYPMRAQCHGQSSGLGDTRYVAAACRMAWRNRQSAGRGSSSAAGDALR